MSAPSSSPEVVLGSGADGFAPVAEDDALPLVLGPQGGAHIWMAVRASGFEMPVGIELKATDAFTGEVVASGLEAHALNALAGADLECERHRLYLYVESSPGEGAGLADVAVTVTDAAGRSAADTRRVWLGTRMPACLPGDDPSLTPLSVTSPWLVGAHDQAIEQDARLKASDPSEPRRFLFGVATSGLAASAVVLEVSLLDPDDPLHPITSGRTDWQTDVSTGRPQGVGELCYLPLTVPLFLPEGWEGRPVLLRAVVEDGLGGHATRDSLVTLEAADAT